MAITLTAASVVGSGISRTSTPPYTVGAASTLLVCVISSTVQPAGVTYGGNAMTIASAENTSTSQWTTLAYLLFPPTGVNNFGFTISAGSISICAADYSGVASADGSAVTNMGGSGTSSLTTNVPLAAAGEWVVVAGISGHLSNVFQPTTNLTVEAQSNTFITCALMDTAGGLGPGTVGIVSTVNGSSPNLAVVLRAFAPSGAASNNGALAETFADFTLAGTGSVPAHGALAEAFADFMLAGTGSVPAHGALAEAFADFTLAGTGSVPAHGALAEAFADFGLMGSGTAGGSNNGALAEAFADFGLMGAGELVALGTLMEMFADFELAGTGSNGAGGGPSFPFYPLDPSHHQSLIVKPYSGKVGDAFGGAPAGAGYPAANPNLRGGT